MKYYAATIQPMEFGNSWNKGELQQGGKGI